MDISLTKLKIENRELSLNLELFDNLYEIIKNVQNDTILLEDDYYNSFYDGEVSLFWLYFKTYVGLRKLKNGIPTNFECIHIIDSKNLTKINKPHVIKFFHDSYIDFFTNLKKINPSYNTLIIKNNNSFNNDFVEYMNDCGPKDKWQFTEKNIECLLMKSINENINDRENIFLVKPKSKYSMSFGNFYWIDNQENDDNELSHQKTQIIKLIKEILKTNCDCNSIIIFKEVKNDDELEKYYKLIKCDEIKNINKNNTIVFLLRINHKSSTYIKLYLKKTNINSSLIFKNEKIPTSQLIIKNTSASFLLGFLKILYKKCEINDYSKKFKIRKIANLIFKFIFTGEQKIKKLKNLYDEFYIEDDEILKKIKEEIENLKSSTETVFLLEENIKFFIKNSNTKEIFLSKSNFYLNNEDLYLIQDWIKEIIEDSTINIKIFDKNYPIEIAKNSLLIYLGDDNISKYFSGKINLLNIRLDYILDEKEMEMIYDFEKSYERSFLLKSYCNSEILPQNKQILYYLENDFNIYSDSIEDMYDSGIENAFILTNFSGIEKHCQNFINSYSKNSKTRNEIKKHTQRKVFEKHNKFNLSSKEYYAKLSNLFISILNIKEKQVYENIIKKNIHLWIGGGTLPRNSELFLKFLEFINLKDEAAMLLKEHRYETALNQNSGREVSKQIQRIFNKEWDENEDYNKLVKDLKNSNLFKKYTIEINGEEE